MGVCSINPVSNTYHEVLIKWKSGRIAQKLHGRINNMFPILHLEDKVALWGWGIEYAKKGEKGNSDKKE